MTEKTWKQVIGDMQTYWNQSPEERELAAGVPQGTPRQRLAKIMKEKSTADDFNSLFLWVLGVGCLLLVPLTFGTSLFLLVAIPPIAALGAIATHTRRTSKINYLLAEIQLLEIEEA